MRNNIINYLLDYGNDKIEKSIEEETICNSLHAIYSSIDDTVKLRFDFDMSEEGI